MTIKSMGEFELIKRLTRGCVINPDRVAMSIGDDAAAFFTPENQATLLTTDLLIERVHFLKTATTGFNLGYKSLAVNLSDIAAMGGTAHNAFVSIGIPNHCEIDFIEDIYHGIKHLAQKHQVNVLGGDTTRSMQDLVINVAVVGSVMENEMLCRHNAGPGDLIFTTGFLGNSRAGLDLIINGVKPETSRDIALFNSHILPDPCLSQGRLLAKSGCVSACIDVSDGLSSDLGHLLAESRVGARVFSHQLPISSELKSFCKEKAVHPVSYALSGGEDYTLLFTVNPKRAKGLMEMYEKNFNAPIHLFGEITEKGPLILVHPDGREESIKASGWDHFKE